ncbi:uncharacterized protein H6S33_012694 [Morchella sextelata]|uniref:uncharacterized protein n=1 Tax=Morchella sextelata TaxID=1174677 RepID=UPI001D03C571|nr:uncharacterized protein H6S33_012694 [Morchella sextelata]KAH0610148.1 hypothetical protein H6S33_012694 [Morchella sextelata]
MFQPCSCLCVNFWISVALLIAQALASTGHGGSENHILKRSALNVQRPAVRSSGTPAATYDKYNVRSDDSWWCGLSAVGSPAEFHPDSIYPVNHLFTAAAVSKTMAMVVGLGRGNFRKYPGNFMNRDPAGKTLLPDIVLSPGFSLKYFPILHDGSKWAPKSKDASQDAGNFRMVYSTSADKKTVKFHGLVFHPPKSQELRVCLKLTPEELKAAKKKMQASAPRGRLAAAAKL